MRRSWQHLGLVTTAVHRLPSWRPSAVRRGHQIRLPTSRPRWRRPPLRRSVSAKPWTGMLWTARLPKEKPSAGMVAQARSQKQDTRRETQRNSFYRCAAAAASSHLLEMVTAAVAAQSGRTGATRFSRELWRPLSSSPQLCLHPLVAAATALRPIHPCLRARGRHPHRPAPSVLPPTPRRQLLMPVVLVALPHGRCCHRQAAPKEGVRPPCQPAKA